MNGAFSSSEELLSLRVLLDPYPFYHWLREREPVHWSQPLDTWMVTGYHEAVEALRDPRLSSRIDLVPPEALTPEAQADLKPLFDLQRRWMQQSDPPEHTSIRNPWVRLFGSGAADRMALEMTTFAQEVVKRGVDEGELDVIEAFSVFPALVLGRALGLEPEEMARFQPWIDEYVEFRLRPTYETGRRALESVRAWRADLMHILERRSSSADPGVLSSIRDLQGEEQLFATITSLMSGRYEPTIGLIGNGLLALLRHPDQHPQSLGTAFSVEAAVEEMLRYDCPFQSAIRLAREDMLLGGREIHAGQKLLILLGAANRDPARFEQPDAFHINRADQGHLAFGFGAHYCLGPALARTMACAALAALIEQFPRMHTIDRRPDWQFDVAGYRALRALPVRFA